MKVSVLKELKTYTYTELKIIFNVDNEQLDEIIKSLSLMNILKRINKQSVKYNLQDLLDYESFNENNDINGNSYVLNYVGILYINHICLLVYPKFYNKIEQDKNNGFLFFKLILNVIRKYNSKIQYIESEEANEMSNFNLLSLGLEIYSDYFESGLYINDKQMIELNTDGEILWDKTINDTTIYLVDNIPYYLDIYYYNQMKNDQDFFTVLHSTVISKITRTLKDIFNIMNIEQIYIDNDELDLSNNEYINYMLDRELSNQFVTSKQKKIKLIKKYINKKTDSNISENISFVGTTSFKSVWEDVCSVVNDNSKDKTLESLGIDCLKDKSMKLSDVIKKPEWTPEGSEIKIASKSTLIPDIITIKDNNIYIYDAKYYNIKFDELGVEGAPGVNDISKQYLYEMSYINFAEENNLKIIRNAFLMPNEDDEKIKLGKVSFDIFSIFKNNNLNDIEIYLVPAKYYFHEYLKRN
ncbi:LlaJI family restriction endonuclease [Macrococcoides caseolyticum]|uniref:Uncharacterized protein n=1 Tax=Macrococcoides caseolyticum TaxID=69966 RepID=A0ACC9MS03_9STAP|nr:LlaJI family restriction endonuclease [Macrococcus caseolyticus]PKE39174.1 hypothetical protein CW675_07985 [Macrococcus caseolyticus]PKE56220.1 hypothetical protein CW682_08265 [Macrococcus caseolyticus]